MTDLALVPLEDFLGRSQDQLDDDYRRVTEMYTQGYTPAQIAEEIAGERRGYTERAARLDLMAVKERWATSLPVSQMAAAQEELAANEALLTVAWTNYRAAEENLARADYLTNAEEGADEPSGATTFSPNVPVRMTNAGRSLALRVRAQASSELKTWWEAILRLRQQRAQLLGLVSGGINVNIDQRQVSMDGDRKTARMVYVSWSPEEWDAAQREASDDDSGIVDGEVSDVDGIDG